MGNGQNFGCAYGIFRTFRPLDNSNLSIFADVDRNGDFAIQYSYIFGPVRWSVITHDSIPGPVLVQVFVPDRKFDGLLVIGLISDLT